MSCKYVTMYIFNRVNIIEFIIKFEKKRVLFFEAGQRKDAVCALKTNKKILSIGQDLNAFYTVFFIR